jgi:hypothetical protein
MTEEEMLLHFQANYPGVYLAVSHQCRLHGDKPEHEWMFWHDAAGEHIGPCPTGPALFAAVEAWEASGERAAACEVRANERAAQQRRERLARERLRVADPSYVPTLDEALRHPDAFVEGMTETTGFHSDPRD